MGTPVRPHRRRCVSCGGLEVFRYEGRRGPHSAGQAGYAASGELDDRGMCLTCEIRAEIAAAKARQGEESRAQRRLPRGGHLSGRAPALEGEPGAFQVRQRPGEYLVRYPGRSRPFTARGRLGVTWGRGSGRTPVIVGEDGRVLVLDPRAVITRKGRRSYGPRDVADVDQSPGLRAWLARHSEWDS